MGAIDAIGWPETARAVHAQARRLDDDRAAHVLDGLRAIRSHPELVELLDHLVESLKGDLRNRAILLVEQKRLVLELDAIAGLFRERRSPYRIDRVLGQGLFTAAYLAHDERHDMEVVVRILRREFVHQPMVRAHFLGLSHRCVPLAHQNLVSTRDAGDFRDRDVFFSIRQYVDGVTLQEMLGSGRRFTTAEAVALLRQVADALVPLHEAGIVHGGIKPSNLFVTRKDRVVLGDPSLIIPGIAVSFDRLSYDYRYASPEQFEGGGRLAPQSDFYALGCVAYELLCGAPPHVADNHYDLVVKHRQGAIAPPASRGSSAGPAGDALVRRLLSRALADRPADAEALVREIDDLREALRAAGGTPRLAPSLLGGALDRYRGVQSLVDLGPGVSGPESGDEDVSEWDVRPGRPAPTATGPGSLGIGGVSPADPFDSGPPASVTPIPAPDTAWPVAPDAPEPSAAGVFPTNEGYIDTTDVPGGEIPASPAPAEEAFDLDEVRGELLVKGRVLFNKYILLEKLGAGGMGEVWKVRHIALESDRALKFLRTGQAPSSHLRERFRREARVMARLSHPNAVEIHDAFTARGMAFIEMAYVPGRSLAEILRPGRRMELDWTVRILEQLCDVLAVAHEAGIVHRDLKPANLMLLADRPPGREFLKVLDFGIAKLLDLDREEPDMGANGPRSPTTPRSAPIPT
jgi:serine/threonine protein kinase